MNTDWSEHQLSALKLLRLAYCSAAERHMAEAIKLAWDAEIEVTKFIRALEVARYKQDRVQRIAKQVRNALEGARERSATIRASQAPDAPKTGRDGE
jgi:hypothetical protein